MNTPQREPEFPEVLIRPDVMVPMRDGVKLAIDLYSPAARSRVVKTPLPALLMRTPYDKGPANRLDAMRLARHGYLVAIQDVRGRYKSEGDFDMHRQEPADGYDTVEWLAAQAPCNGQVGMWGPSYVARVQAAAATQAPPHLAALCQSVGYPDGYHCARQGGALDVFYLSYIVMMAADGKEARSDPAVREALLGMRFDEWLHRLPIRPGRSPLALAPSYERHYFNYVRHECLDEFWLHPGEAMSRFAERWPDVPTLWLCGWFDHYPYHHPDTLAFANLMRLGRRHQYVIFGPWTHGEMGRRVGHVDFGERAAREAVLPDYELRWFDRWLKGIDDDGLFPAPARYFLMGGGSGAKSPEGALDHGGEWRTADAWPPPEARLVPWYLQPGGLGASIPESGPASVTYVADPDDPAPSSAGICYITARVPGGGTRRICPPGAYDQTEGPHLFGAREPYLPLESRHDILVLQSEPLAGDLEVAGQPAVELWVSSDAPDTDFVVRLVDVYPSSAGYPRGFALAVSEGIRRAKFRNGFEQAELLTPGQVVLVRVELRAVANLFQKGHRLRIDVTSSSWPHFDVNTHTGRNPSEDWERRVARNTIYHCAEHPSRLLLPVLSGCADGER